MGIQCRPMKPVSRSHTEASIEAPSGSSFDPEFIRIPDLERRFGIRRSMAYRLIRAGKIKSICLRQRGAATGLRLIHFQSCRDFLLKEMNAQGF